MIFNNQLCRMASRLERAIHSTMLSWWADVLWGRYLPLECYTSTPFQFDHLTLILYYEYWRIFCVEIWIFSRSLRQQRRRRPSSEQNVTKCDSKWRLQLWKKNHLPVNQIKAATSLCRKKIIKPKLLPLTFRIIVISYKTDVKFSRREQLKLKDGYFLLEILSNSSLKVSKKKYPSPDPTQSEGNSKLGPSHLTLRSKSCQLSKAWLERSH